MNNLAIWLQAGLFLVGSVLLGLTPAHAQSEFDLKSVWESLSADERAAYQAVAHDSANPLTAQPRGGGFAADTCAAAVAVPGTLPFNDADTTVGNSDTYQYGAACGGFNSSSGAGPDVAYRFRTDVSCDLTVTMDPEAVDLALWVVTDCGDPVAGCVGGNDSGGSGTPETVGPFTATAGTDYFVIVDGFAGASGAYTLNISENSATGCVLLGDGDFTVGGTVSGLAGSGLELQNNGGDTLPIAADGPFTFATALADGSNYEVTVSNQPVGQLCSVDNESGTISGADVDDVLVDCSSIQIGFSAMSLTFPSTPVNGSSSATLIISNPGALNLDITAFSMLAAPFSIAGGDCLPLATELVPGASCSVEISFEPTSTGDFQENLLVTHSAAGSPSSITLSATGAEQFSPIAVPFLNKTTLWVLILMMLVAGYLARTRLRRSE